MKLLELAILNEVNTVVQMGRATRFDSGAAHSIFPLIRLLWWTTLPIMESTELFAIISRAEDSKHQFKADVRNVETLAAEMVAFSNSDRLIHGDEVPVPGMTAQEIDLDYFRHFFEQQYDETLDDQELPLAAVLENMNLMQDGVLNVSGALLFGKKLEFRLPAFCVKCVAYPGNDIHVAEFRDNEDIAGRLEEVFKGSLAFMTRNLKRVQNGRNVNALGELEIPKITLEELLINALVHRDYFISAPIRLFMFDNRIEIISPGHLPNNLTIEHIKRGNSNIRNPILASFAAKILPYRGLGNGIRLALKAYAAIDFEDDHDGNLFKVTIKRRNPDES
jgi:ATP-dependent DNA helicase RecG